MIGSKIFGKTNVLSYVGIDSRTRQAARNKVTRDVNASLRESLGADAFVDVQRLVCGVEGLCPVFTPDGDLIAYDGGHLTKGGAKWIGEIVFSLAVLAQKYTI